MKYAGTPAAIKPSAVSVGRGLSTAEFTTNATATITTKLRYQDFSIRSRSTTFSAGVDDGTRIADAACALLDRALDDRSGALRLVGVAVSGLQPYRQLELV